MIALDGSRGPYYPAEGYWARDDLDYRGGPREPFAYPGNTKQLLERTKPMAKSHIVLTGATRGLGRALVSELARSNCILHGCGTHEAALKALRHSFPAPHTFTALDIRDDEQVSRWSSQILESSGAPDFLLNVAGVINPNATLWDTSATEFQRVMDVNVCGTANTIRHFVPAMIERGRGVIANFSSTWGRSVSPEVAPYCASKWAIEGLSRALAHELPAGLASIALNPGIIDTEMLRSCFGPSAGDYETPEEWASRAAPFILGLSADQNGRSLDIV